MKTMNRKILNKKLELTFEFVVKDFSTIDMTVKQVYEDNENLGFKFLVEVKPKVVENNGEYVSVHFAYARPGPMGQFPRRNIKKFFRVSVGIVDKYGNIVNKKGSPFLNMRSMRMIEGWDHFIHRNQILSPESNLLWEKDLKFWCNLEVSDEMPSIFSDSQSINTFQECYKSLMTDQQLSDLTLVVDGREFPVHKAVLGARSPVFRAMITTDMKEKRESRIVLHDFDEETVEQTLHFIYTGNAPKIKELAKKLSIAADFFDLPDLKLSCAHSLFSELNENNVMEALKFGQTYGIKELVINAIDFIGDNREKIRSNIIQSDSDFI